MFYNLIEFISLNSTIFDHYQILPKLNQKLDYIMDTLCSYNKFVEINENRILIFKVWYIFDIFEILYSKDIIIEINQNISDFTCNLYFALLIERRSNFIDYKYNLEYIKCIFLQIQTKENLKYYTLILSKIILIILDYYENNWELTEDMDYYETIKNKARNNVENNGVFGNDDILDKSIEELYSMVIINLTKKEILQNYNILINIINEIDLEKFDITKKIFDEIKKFFDKKENIEEYIILEKEDFGNIQKVNFYYIFLKYVFKNNYFIYNFDFFYKTRKYIINKAKSGYTINSFICSVKNKDILERAKYIIEILLDTDYYINKLKNNKINELIENVKTLDEDSGTITNISSQNLNQIQPIININNNSQIQNNSLTNNYSSNNSSYSLTNRLIQSVHNNNIIHFIRIINEKPTKDKNEIEQILEFKSGFISWGSGENIEIYDRYYEKTKEISTKGEMLNNIMVEDSEDKVSIIMCFQDKIKLYELKNLKDIIKNLKFREEKLKDYCGNFLYITRVDKDNYLICYEKKINYYYNDLFSPIIIPQSRSYYIGLVMSAIKIDKDKIALKSCGLNDINDNKIMMINITKEYKYNVEIKGYSLLFSHYGLSLMSVANKNKILLCACKKYFKDQKNGILLINLKNIETEIKQKYEYFYDTEEFEVYCFCPILTIIPGEKVHSEFKYIDTDFFLVGGFDSEKSEGCIKLYKINCDEEMNKYTIEFIQDIDDFKGFKNPVNCIIQEKYTLDKKILVTTLDDNIYLFAGPDIEHHLKENEEMKGEVSFDDFFKETDL